MVCLAAVSEGPEGAQRVDVAGGTGVEQRLVVAEFLGVAVGGSEVTEGLDVTEFLGVTVVSPSNAV